MLVGSACKAAPVYRAIRGRRAKLEDGAELKAKRRPVRKRRLLGAGQLLWRIRDSNCARAQFDSQLVETVALSRWA